MNKFEQMLSRSGDRVLKDRAESVSKLATMAQTRLVQKLEEKSIELDMKKQELIDLSPDNRQTLKLGRDFNPEQWVEKYQSVSLDIVNNEVELKTAVATMYDLFTEEKSNE